MQLSAIDVVIILGETLFVVVIGIVTAFKAEKTTDGYFLAAGKMPWWLIGAAFVSTGAIAPMPQVSAESPWFSTLRWLELANPILLPLENEAPLP